MRNARVQRLIALGAAVLLLGVLVSCGPAQLVGPSELSGSPELLGRAITVQGDPVTVALVAKRRIPVGTVAVAAAGDYLQVTYTTTNGWQLVNAELWLGQNLSSMPRERHGALRVERFPYKSGRIAGQTSYVFLVPVADLGGESAVQNKTFFVAAHADVRKDRADRHFRNRRPRYVQEEAWGDGQRLTKHWKPATYFTFTFGASAGGGLVKGDPEDAFALGDQSFMDFDLSDYTNWGWALKITGGVNPAASTPIYARADGYDMDSAEQVGTLSYSYDPGTSALILTFQFDLDPETGGWVADQTDVYVANLIPGSADPSTYAYHHDLTSTEGTADSYTISISIPASPPSRAQIYVVAHAMVAPMTPGN